MSAVYARTLIFHESGVSKRVHAQDGGSAHCKNKLVVLTAE